MRMFAKTMVAIGLLGAAAVAVPSAASAQGIYFQGPGVEFGIGRPYYRDRYSYRYYDEARTRIPDGRTRTVAPTRTSVVTTGPDGLGTNPRG